MTNHGPSRVDRPGSPLPVIQEKSSMDDRDRSSREVSCWMTAAGHPENVSLADEFGMIGISHSGNYHLLMAGIRSMLLIAH
jgi:hypothetical protein